MLRHRCPWCGERIPSTFWRYTITSPFTKLFDPNVLDTCPHCKKKYKNYCNSIAIVFLFTLFLYGEIFYSIIKAVKVSSAIYWIFFILFLVTVLIETILLNRIPYTRNYREKKDSKKSIIVTSIIVIFMLIFCIIPLITNNMTAFTWIALFIWLSLFLFATIKHLVKQKEKPKVDPLPMQKRTVNATISWESHKNKGLLYPKFQVMNGEIFPVCFIDENGVPISLMLCVVMEHFHWTDSHHCVCTIQLVLDDTPEDKLLQKGNRFYLYHNYGFAATGTIS